MTLTRYRRSAAQRRTALSALLLACSTMLPWLPAANAQGPGAASRPVPKAAEQGVRWAELKPGQQATLKPLEREWPGIEAGRKQKWLELAAGFPKMTPAEQGRIQERMAEWARLTPQERGQARLNFQEAKQVPAQDRQERWNAYQALSPEQKQQFAARAAPGGSGADAGRKGVPPVPTRAEKSVRDAPQAKSNIVPNPALAAPPKAIAPTVVQARPGATTTLITKRPSPPAHQQTGLPKIAATPEFVDKATLLPQRGPQGAAARSASAAKPSPAQ